MKKRHLAHIIATLMTTLYGLYCLGSISPDDMQQTLTQYYDQRASYTIKYGIAVGILFLFTAFLGYYTYKEMKKTGFILLLGGVGFSIWNVVMICNARSLGIDDVMPAHVLWFVIAIGANIIVVLQWRKIRWENWKDELLDSEQYKL